MNRTNPWKKLERLAQGAHSSDLVPVLGSGFVTQAVLEGARMMAGSASERRGVTPGIEGSLRSPRPHGASGPPSSAKRPRPVDWYALLEGVAKEFQCVRAASMIERDVPGQTTLLWDAMLAELAQRSPRTTSAHAWEAKLRRAVARRLREDTVTLELSRSFVDSFLRLGWDDVLSYNFDRVLLTAGARPTHAASGAAKRASLFAESSGARIWFPHGHQADPDSIVLGAHAYGVRIAAMQAAFDSHARKPLPRGARKLDTWVATALERPLLFMGLSLTREEWTIWWLLTQRARFLARRPQTRRPAAFVFARRPSSHERLETHAAFQTLARACELLDLTLLEFSDYASGWKKVRAAIGWPV
ncbi:MAG: hypothetical protein HOW73_32730 [Polyangiaceae bacterium]|nr:hypothetical protein [Polyangiaceae bacterium]